TLPDEQQLAAKSTIRWAAGAMDGVATHHMGGKDTDQARQLLKIVRTYCKAPTAANKAGVYEALLEKQVVCLIDPFLESPQEQTGVNHERLYDLARSFATESPDREPVTFGVAVLGLCGRQEDTEILGTLGRHEEFTLFSAVALQNICED